MLNVDVINKEILDLEKKDTSYAVVERLAWLYTVRDHMSETHNNRAAAPEKQTDFTRAISGKNEEELWCIISDLMDSLKIAQPRTYDLVMSKIQSLD